MGGQCMKKEIVYQATVNSEGGKIENYVGLTANTFKERFSGHLFNFKHENSKGTTLSAYIWKLKNENRKYEISWKILQHAKPFTPENGQCALCTAEKKNYNFQARISHFEHKIRIGSLL